MPLTRRAGRCRNFTRPLAVHLVEISPVLAHCKRRARESGVPIEWHHGIEEIATDRHSRSPRVFDALPISQSRQGPRWSGMSAWVGIADDKLSFMAGTDPCSVMVADGRRRHNSRTALRPTCVLTRTADRPHGGAALVIDTATGKARSAILAGRARHTFADPWKIRAKPI